jgi:predicted double-glycine peptidase
MVVWRSISLLAAATLLYAMPAVAGTLFIETNGDSFNVPVRTLKEIRFMRVVKQEFDFSCGSAALATLLTYHYNRPTPEDAVLKAMYEHGDQEKIHQEGFSLLDIKEYLESIGLRSDGYEVGLDKIAEVGIPGLALIKTQGYLHFVVLKGVRGDQVLVGDPALGTKLMSRDQFTQIWNGIFFAIVTDTRRAKTEFNRKEDWQVHVAAPLGSALTGQSLATLTMLIPGRNSF